MESFPARSVFEGDEPTPVAAAAGPQYPSGFRFAMIFGALLTSMFLVALDMVSGPPSHVHLRRTKSSQADHVA